MDTSDLGLLILRLGVGSIFAAHGAQKAFGWWSGPAWGGWQAVMVRLGFRPAAAFAGVSLVAELGGGVLLAVGFLTPLATLLLIGQLVVIIARAHWARGFWNRDNGFEFPLSLLAGAIALALIGPGALSVDSLLGIGAGEPLRLGLVALGAAGGLATASLPELARRDDEAAAGR